MRIQKLGIRNFRAIKNMVLDNLENALILVGKNSTGKTAVLEAISMVAGTYQVSKEDFREGHPPVLVEITLAIDGEDLRAFQQQGMVSKYRRYDAWLEDFKRKLPSYQEGILTFTCTATWQGELRYSDGKKKHNPYILQIFPKVYYIDTQRNLGQFQNGILFWMEDDLMKRLRSGCCMFDQAKACTHCFECMGLIHQKSAGELNAFEAARLLDYKLYQLNLDEFSRKMNRNFRRNGGQEEIIYSMNRNVEQMLSVTAVLPVLSAVWRKECEVYICFRYWKRMRRETAEIRELFWWKNRKSFFIRRCRRLQEKFCIAFLRKIRWYLPLIHRIFCPTLTPGRFVRWFWIKKDVPESWNGQISAGFWMIWGIRLRI